LSKEKKLYKPNLKRIKTMLQKKEQVAAIRWFWNPPINGYTIEDCEIMMHKILMENKDKKQISDAKDIKHQ